MPIAKLTIDGETRQCTQFSYRVLQSVDHNTGRPSTNVAPLELNATFYSQKSEAFFGFCIDATKKVKGKLEIMDAEDKNKPLKTMNFEDAIITAYSEACSDLEKSEPKESISLIARKSDINGSAKHEIEWKRA
jgi:Hemolysin coregulated protein Hcp (TssD)